MKRFVLAMILLCVCRFVAAEERLIFSSVGSFTHSGGYYHAELDSVLRLYSYGETAGMMRITRRCYSPQTSEVETLVLWEQPIPLDLGNLQWHGGERAYGKLWTYLSHNGRLDAISIDAQGTVQTYQIPTPGFAYMAGGEQSLQHFGEGNLYFVYNRYLWRWDLDLGELNSVVQMPGNGALSLQRLGDEYLLLTQYPQYPAHPPCYLIDSGHDLILTDLQNWFFHNLVKMQDGLYWARFERGIPNETYGSASLQIFNGSVSVGVWVEYDPMFAGYSEYKPLLGLPFSRYLCDNMHINSSGHEYHYFKIVQHNGGNNFGYFNGFPGSNAEAQLLRALYFQDRLLLMGWQFYWLPEAFFAMLADLQTQTWIPVVFDTPFTGQSYDLSVLDNDDYLWFIFRHYNGNVSLNAYRGQISVANDDQAIPPLSASLDVYPNPFNPSTTVSFSLSGPASVELDIYNLKGQRVRRLEARNFPAGNHSTLFDGKDDTGSDLSTGIYLLRMRYAGRILTRKLSLIK